MRISRSALIGALLTAATATAAAGQSGALPSGGAAGQRAAMPVIDDADRMVLPGNVPPLARSEFESA